MGQSSISHLLPVSRGVGDFHHACRHSTFTYDEQVNVECVTLSLEETALDLVSRLSCSEGHLLWDVRRDPRQPSLQRRVLYRLTLREDSGSQTT